MNAIKDFIKNFRLNHHSCTRNSKMIDSFTNSFTNSTTNCKSFGYSSVNVYKCKICGKTWDIC